MEEKQLYRYIKWQTREIAQNNQDMVKKKKPENRNLISFKSSTK